MRDIKALVAEMTVEEKAGLCSGADFWHTKGIDRLGIPSVMLSDGPHGLRKQDDKGDHLGINESIQAVCFPAASCTSNSFDRNLLREMGRTIGQECQAEDVSVVLGPGLNIKRSPLCGRNFEYFSEDPYLTGQLASAFVQGVQSEGVATSPKHFAVNNQENWRMSISAEVDQQTLREIYLPAFETVVKEAQPKTIMSSYNLINGVYASENRWLLTDILRKEWGFNGYVVSDWGAVDRRVDALKAGLDLEMPSSNGHSESEILAAITSGQLEEAELDKAVIRLLTVIFDYVDHKKELVFDYEGDHQKARHIAEESAVLLKNEGVLPLAKDQQTAIIGEFARTPRYQGGGSSHVNPYKVISAWDVVKDQAGINFAQGYSLENEEINQELIDEAVLVAQNSDVAVVFAGLPESFESEGYDRTHIQLPANQNALISAVALVNPNTVVVLQNGAVVAMPWHDEVSAILEMYLAGEAVGQATINLLYGTVNPSGHLAETFPYKLEDNPSYLNFPGNGRTVEYREGIFVGYRYYDKKKMAVQYPFGYGLSYTNFAYSNLTVSSDNLLDTDTLSVKVTVTNVGKIAGKEVVQLYVSSLEEKAERPVRELKGFEKIFLQPGESQVVGFTLSKRSFAQFNTDLNDWYVPTGDYEVTICRHSRDEGLVKTVHLTSTQTLPYHVHRNSTFGELIDNPKTRGWAMTLKAKVDAFFHPDGVEKSSAVSDDMGDSIFRNMPLRGMISFVNMTSQELDAAIADLNRN